MEFRHTPSKTFVDENESEVTAIVIPVEPQFGCSKVSGHVHTVGW